MQRDTIEARDEDRCQCRIDGGAAIHLGGRGERDREGGIALVDTQPLGHGLGHWQGADRRARDEGELDRRPGLGEEGAGFQAIGDQQQRIDHQQDEAEAEIDGGGEGAELRQRAPAIGGDRGADQRGRADRRQADDPAQDRTDDGEQRADEGEEGLRLVADLQRGEADCDRDDQQLQDVERDAGAGAAVGDLGAARQGQAVAGDQTFQEIEPAADRIRLAHGERGAVQARARLDDQADGKADADRDQRGDREPEQRLAGETGGIVERA